MLGEDVRQHNDHLSIRTFFETTNKLFKLDYTRVSSFKWVRAGSDAPQRAMIELRDYFSGEVDVG